MNIEGQVAVVTGAGSGIGRAVAISLAQRGVKAVGLVDRNESVREVARTINEQNGDGKKIAEPFIGDTTDELFQRKTYDKIIAGYGTPTICVPAAGITRDQLATRIDKATGRALLYPRDTFRLVVEVNLIAPVYWALEMVGRIAEARHRSGLGRWMSEEGIQGSVIFVGSVSSHGIPGQIAYASTKAGLEGAEATLTKEAIFYGVHAAIVHPGFTNTPMVQVLGEEYIKKNILPYTRLGRLIEPPEIAEAICFLISNSEVSGHLWADAGWHPPF
ncbi:MAG TPA: SDR family oxidoreductase [Chthoniobacterales bacterium]|jgi:NAD(P)-dependent dehydrogenase (short-subunit alcohol dehydrogenase family)|nr:SDR family oxidoreductase [Chthoniobacterales bacterium]